MRKSAVLFCPVATPFGLSAGLRQRGNISFLSLPGLSLRSVWDKSQTYLLPQRASAPRKRTGLLSGRPWRDWFTKSLLRGGIPAQSRSALGAKAVLGVSVNQQISQARAPAVHDYKDQFFTAGGGCATRLCSVPPWRRTNIVFPKACFVKMSFFLLYGEEKAR